MTAAAFRRALKALGWSQAVAARELGACNQQRVSEWHRGAQRVPPYIAAHLETQLRLLKYEPRN